MVGFSATVEPMHVANRLSGRTLYDWSILSVDGGTQKSSSGMPVPVDDPIASAQIKHDLIVICSGFFSRATAKSPRLLDWLRKQASFGCTMGAISTGAEILANAGLLDDYRCTIHWENEQSFRENHPRAILTGGIFEISKSGLRLLVALRLWI
jgi:AraC family carnitine catabolism transcriptional activator